MTSNGLETPPGSARSSITEFDRQPHPYTQPPTGLHGDYLSPNETMYPPPSRDHGRGAPRDIPYPSYNTSAHQASGGHSPNSRYLYTPYGLETRPPLPPPYDHRNELPSLPWPPTAPPRRYPEPIPSIGGPHIHDPWVDNRNPNHVMREVPDTGYRCSSARCRFTASSPEQLTRHQQKHLKIHYCRFTPCPRTEGFATPNDRERHEKSIHKIPGCYWKCLDNNCGSYGKEFSRRDNLKDHLKRMHPVPEGMSENEASALRSRLADTWRFDKGSHAEAAGRDGGLR
ncbi:hypothetical protein BDD12DRAFT_875474 [Trichophaea hybrida]|nr:hypothetical protein BDD12DRAFT_875474 [Trichophaea hybrida]